MIEQKSFSGWAYVSRAEDVPGCWVAHCLDYNIVSFGDSPQHALEMVREAVALALADDLNHGRDPSARRADSSEEDWAPLVRLFKNHTKVPVRDMDTSAREFKEFAAPLTVVLVNRQGDGIAPDAKPVDVHSDALLAA